MDGYKIVTVSVIVHEDVAEEAKELLVNAAYETHGAAFDYKIEDYFTELEIAQRKDKRV